MRELKMFFILIQIFWSFSILLNAQNSSIATQGHAGTYAVIIGVTKYQNPAIPALQFADRDGHEFYNWLQSGSGGDVPPQNIKLLVNEEATIAAIYQALDWLKEVCKENDKAYIYFSGHGDVETKNNFSKGYLLAYNSPQNNYANNAVSIEDFNNTSIALTTKNKAKVIIISDACRSGKLAGDFFKGKQLAAAQLRQVLNDQVRLASCRETELAAEGPDWGGGRGVFSYYLLLGLQGLAPVNHDGTVQLNVLQKYLDSSFSADKTLLKSGSVQHPVADGNPYFVMSRISSGATERLKDSLFRTIATRSLMPEGLSALKPLARQPVDYFFSKVSAIPIESKIDIAAYRTIDRLSLAFTFVADCIAYQQKLYKERDAQTDPSEDFEKYEVFNLDSLNMLANELKTNSSLPNRFIEKFILMVHHKAQEMINAYLKGDAEEMERRQYYYSGERDYKKFLPLLHLAMKLVPSSHQLAHILSVNNFYLTGLFDRLQMATTKKTGKLLQHAFYNQQQALKLEPYAAYILNELGNLHLRKNNYDSARFCYDLSTVMAPTWAIPWSNKIRMNLAFNKLNQAVQDIRMADSLQANLAFVLTNAGIVMEKKNNLLAAESYYLRAIKENNVHYLPYEKLGYLYLKTGRYDSANIYLEKAEIRKDPFAVNDVSFRFGIEAGAMLYPPYFETESAVCLDRIPANENGIRYKKLLKGIEALKDSSTSKEGIDILKELIKDHPAIPLADHFLGKKYFHEGNWQLAQQYLEKSVYNHLTDQDLLNRVSMDILKKSFADSDSCLFQPFLNVQYDLLEDLYLLAAIFEKRNLFDKVFEQYEAISKLENNRQTIQATLSNYDELVKNFRGEAPEFMLYFIYHTEKPIIMAGAIKSALLYEKSGQYEQAEKILLKQVELNRAAGFARQTAIVENKPGWKQNGAGGINFYWLNTNSYLETVIHNFYERMIQLFPRDAYWYEKQGFFLFNRLRMAFERLNVKQINLFYHSLEKYAYPWIPGDGQNPVYDFVTPGVEDTLYFNNQHFDPVKKAIETISTSIKFSGEMKPKTEASIALARLNSWIGNEDEAINWFRQYLAQNPRDKKERTKFIEYLTYTNHLPEAMEQQHILYDNKTASIKQQIQLADGSLLAGLRTDGINLLQEINSTDSEDKREILLIKSRDFFLQGNTKMALRIISDSVKNNTISEEDDYELRRKKTNTEL